MQGKVSHMETPSFSEAGNTRVSKSLSVTFLHYIQEIRCSKLPVVTEFAILNSPA